MTRIAMISGSSEWSGGALTPPTVAAPDVIEDYMRDRNMGTFGVRGALYISPRMRFDIWVKAQAGRDDHLAIIGGLAEYALRDPNFPRDFRKLMPYLRIRGSERSVRQAALIAIREYRRIYWSPGPQSKLALKKLRKTLPARKRFEILQRDHFRCCLCGRNAEEDSVKLHVDHQQPVSKGGTDDYENLWTLCADCNFGKADGL